MKFSRYANEGEFHSFTTTSNIRGSFVFIIALSMASGVSLAESQSQIEEVIVTANKRTESIQDIASAVQVLGGMNLEDSNAASFNDYLYKLPGVNIVDSGLPKQIAIRGIANLAQRVTQINSTASPVGLYVNETAIQGNGVLPDLGLYDLQRIEVLKGPQGTFYGEGAMGGMLRMVLNDAAPGEFSIKGDVGYGETDHASGSDSFANIAINIPLGGTWATRVIASTRVDSGYINFPGRGTKGEDELESDSYRIHLNGSLFEKLDVAAFHLHQSQSRGQFSFANPNESGDMLTYTKTEDQFQETEFSLSSISLSYDAGFASITGTYSHYENENDVLLRAVFVSNIIKLRTSEIEDLIGINPYIELEEEEWNESSTFQDGSSFEVRAVSNGEGAINWIVGAYQREKEAHVISLAQSSLTKDIPPPLGPGTLYLDVLTPSKQSSIYGEVSLRALDGLEFKVGYRSYEEEIKAIGYAEFRGPLLPLFPPDGKVNGLQVSESNDETVMGSVSWYMLEDAMVYLRYAEGTRSGGINNNGVYAEVPEYFEPDYLTNMEIGFKSEWLDRRLVSNLVVYDQKWDDMQIGTTRPAVIKGTAGAVSMATNLILNIGEGYSRGAEADVAYRWDSGWTLSAVVSYSDGVIEKGDPDGLVPDGTPLPQLAPWSYSVSLSYRMLDPLFWGLSPHGSLDVQYTDKRSAFPPGQDAGLPEDSDLEEFTVWNANFGLRGENWSVGVVLKNILDERYAVGLQPLEATIKTVARPRSYAVKLSYEY